MIAPAEVTACEPPLARALRIGIVAGESSGDQLGAALIGALRERVPGVQCFGVAGPKMIDAGCEAWAHAEELAVMGFTEVLPHLPRILRLRAERPNFYLLDEPTSHLDIEGQEALESELEEADVSCLFVSHDRYFTRAAANRFLEIRRGRLVEIDDPDAFFAAQA